MASRKFNGELFKFLFDKGDRRSRWTCLGSEEVLSDEGSELRVQEAEWSTSSLILRIKAIKISKTWYVPCERDSVLRVVVLGFEFTHGEVYAGDSDNVILATVGSLKSTSTINPGFKLHAQLVIGGNYICVELDDLLSIFGEFSEVGSVEWFQWLDEL